MATRVDPFALLSQAGVQRLSQHGNEIWGLCPGHQKRTGSPDHKPSWSLNTVTLVHHCFSCGYSGTLQGLLVDLTGSAPVDLEDTIKTQSFLREMAEVQAHPETVLEPVAPLLTDWYLFNVLVAVPQALLELRYLKREAIDAYQVRYDKGPREWVLPVRSPTGDLIGAQYRTPSSAITLPKGMARNSTLFGYCQMCHHDYCVIVESPLDAVRLFGLGIPALASLGAWVAPEQIALLARTFSVVFTAMDNDQAGRQATVFLTKGLRNRGCAAVPWCYQGLKDEDGRKAKDVGDVACDEALADSWERTRRFGL